MHWIPITPQEEAEDGNVLFANLDTVTSVTKEPYGIKLYHSDNDHTAIGSSAAPAILARLDALAEITTRCTANALAAITDEVL